MFSMPSIDLLFDWDLRHDVRDRIKDWRHPAYPDLVPLRVSMGRRGGGAAEFIVQFGPAVLSRGEPIFVTERSYDRVM